MSISAESKTVLVKQPAGMNERDVSCRIGGWHSKSIVAGGGTVAGGEGATVVGVAWAPITAESSLFDAAIVIHRNTKTNRSSDRHNRSAP